MEEISYPKTASWRSIGAQLPARGISPEGHQPSSACKPSPHLPTVAVGELAARPLPDS